MIIASASQFHVYLLSSQRLFSIVSSCGPTFEALISILYARNEYLLRKLTWSSSVYLGFCVTRRLFRVRIAFVSARIQATCKYNLPNDEKFNRDLLWEWRGLLRILIQRRGEGFCCRVWIQVWPERRLSRCRELEPHSVEHSVELGKVGGLTQKYH